MAASNCETLRGYLSHSDPASKIQIWEDVSSPTSSVMLLVDSAVSDSRSVSCHTFKKIYYSAPKCDAPSDISLGADDIRRSGVVRIRNTMRSLCAFPIEWGPKTLSVSKTAQDFIKEYLIERDPGSSHASAVYPKRRSKVHKISTSSISIEDADLYCVSENSEDPICSGPKKSENGGKKPAGCVIKGCTTSKTLKTSSDDSEAEACCSPKRPTTKLAPAPEPAPENATIRPRHVHCRARRRTCHAHSWTNIKKPVDKIKNETLTSKLQQLFAGYYPYNCAKCDCKKSHTDNKQAESEANPTRPESDLSCSGPLCPSGKNPSQAAVTGALNPASTITKQESEKAKVEIESEKSNVNGTDLTPIPIAGPCHLQTCPGGCKTPDIQASGVSSLNPKIQCECHAKKGLVQTPKTELNGPAETPKSELNGPAETPKPVLNGPAQIPKPELNGPAETPKPAVNVPSAQTPTPELNGPPQTPTHETFSGGCKRSDIQPLATCPLNTQVPCECHVIGPDQTPKPVAVPCKFETYPGGCKTPDIQASSVCSLNPKVQCECHAKKGLVQTPKPELNGPAESPKPVLNGPAQTPKPELNGPAETPKSAVNGPSAQTPTPELNGPPQTPTHETFSGSCNRPDIQPLATCPLNTQVPCECPVKDPDQTPKPVAVPCKFETYPGGCKTPDIQASGVCSLNPKVQCECHAKKGLVQTPKPEFNGPAETPKPVLNVPAQIPKPELNGPAETPKPAVNGPSAQTPTHETCPGGCKRPDIQPLAACPLNTQVPCECHVKGPDQTPKPVAVPCKFETCPRGCKPPDIQTLAACPLNTEVPCECHVKGPTQTAKTVAVPQPHGFETCPGNVKTLDIRSSAACPLHSKVSCECHVESTHQIPVKSETCLGGCKTPKIRSPAAFILDSKVSCGCYLKDTGLTSESEAAPHEFETCAGGRRVKTIDIQSVASSQLNSKVSCECYVKGSDQTPKPELGTCPGGSKAPRCPGPTICKHQTLEPHMTSPESLEITTNDPQISATQHIGEPSIHISAPIESSSKPVTCPGPDKYDCEIPSCPGGCNVTGPRLSSPKGHSSHHHSHEHAKTKKNKETKKHSSGPEHHKKKHRTWKHHHSTDSGLTDTSIELGESKQSTGTQSEKSNLTRPDGIRSNSAKYKITGIQLELIGFTGSNDAVLNIRSNIAAEGFKANASSACGTAENSCCPCPPSIRSGLAASNVEKRSVTTEYSGTDQKSSAKTSNGANIQKTISDTHKISHEKLATSQHSIDTEQKQPMDDASHAAAAEIQKTEEPQPIRKGRTSSVKIKETDDEHSTISEHGKKRVKHHGKSEESEGEHSPSSEHSKKRGNHYGKSEESEGEHIPSSEHSKKRGNHNGKSEESEGEHSLSSDHSKKRGNHNGKGEESEGVHSACSKRCKKRDKHHANSKESEDEHSPSSGHGKKSKQHTKHMEREEEYESETHAEHKKGFLVSCWPCNLFFRPKKEASVGDCQIGDSSMNKHQATDNGISPCFPLEGIPTDEPINMYSSCCKSCCRTTYSKPTQNFAKTCCANTSTIMRHLYCCDSKGTKIVSDKDLLTVANQNNLKLSSDKKSASEDSLTKKQKEKLLFSIAARNVTTQYSSTYLNYCSKEIPVQKSLSQPIRCQCTANPIRSSSSAPSVDQRMSQQLKMSVLSTEIAPSPYCIYCGQTTREQKNHGHVESQGIPTPLPRPVCQDPSCPAKKQHSKSCYSHTKNPAHRANTVDFGHTCNLMKNKGLDVECLCAGYENEDSDKQTQTKVLEESNIKQVHNEEQQSKANIMGRQGGVQFAMIPRDSKLSDFTTQQGDYVAPHNTSAMQRSDVTATQVQEPQGTAIQTCCSANPKSNVSCECALFAQEHCQSDRQFCLPGSCPGQSHCLGPVSQINQTEFPCGRLCAQKAIALGCAEHGKKKKKKIKPPKPAKLPKLPCGPQLPCGVICLPKQRTHSSASSAAGTTKVAKPSKPPKQPKKLNAQLSCISICSIKLPKPIKTKPLCDDICLQKLAGHGTGLVLSMSGSCSCAEEPALPPNPAKSSKRKNKLKKADFPCGNICLKKITTTSEVKKGKPSKHAKDAKSPRTEASNSTISKSFIKFLRSSTSASGSGIYVMSKPYSPYTPAQAEEPAKRSNPTKPAKSSKKRKPPKAKDFPCGSICLNKLMSGSSVSAVYDASQLITIPTKPTEPPKQSTSSSNSTCSQLTPCGSAYNSAISKTSSKTQSAEPAKRSKELEICFEKPIPCSSTSSSAISKASSKTKAAKPAKSAKNPTLTKGADYLCKNICLQTVASSSNSSSAGISKSSSAICSASAENKVKPPKRAKQPTLTVFSSNSMCFQVITPCGSAYYSGNLKNNSKTKDGKQAKPTKPSKAAKQPKAAEFPCGNICLQKLTPSASDSSLDSKSSSNTTAKPTKPAKQSKSKAADFPCGNICSQKQTTSGNAASAAKSRKSAKPPKQLKPPKATDFPCGNICLQKVSSDSSASSSANPANSSKTSKRPKLSSDFPCGDICLKILTSAGSAISKSSSQTAAKFAKLAKSAEQPKAADFPGGDICLKNLSPSNSASSSAKSSKPIVAKPAKQAKRIPPKAADFPCGNICLNKLSPSNSASISAKPSKTKVAKPAKPQKSAKQPKAAYFPCGNTCLNKVSPSNSASSLAEPSTKAKQAKPPKSKKEILPCGSASSFAVNKEKPKKEILPCGNAFSQTPHSASVAKLKKLKPSKQPKAGKGATLSCNCSQNSPSGSTTNQTAKPPKSPKPDKRAKSPCICPPTMTSCGSARNLTKASKPPKAKKEATFSCECSQTPSPCGSATNPKAKPPKSPKPDKRAKCPCVCPPTTTPCSRTLSLAKASKPPKAKKGAKSPCVCPPTLSPCGSASNVTKRAKSPKSPKPEKSPKSPCVCPPKITPCSSALGLTKTATPPKAKKGGKSPCNCPATSTPSGGATNLATKAKTATPPKSPKTGKNGKPPCVCPPTVTPCASALGITKTATPPKAKKGGRSLCNCPPTSTTCGIAPSLTISGKPPKSPNPPKSPEGKKGAKSPCAGPPNISPCGSGQLTPGRPRTPVKLMKAKGYKGNQVGVISLEEYEKNKKKKKKTKLMNTDILCVPQCQSGCSINKLQQPAPVVVPEFKKCKKRDRWLGIFPCIRPCLPPKNAVPCQCPASGSKAQKDGIPPLQTEPKGGIKYIDCTASSLSGKRKSLKSVVPCECPAADKRYILCSSSSLCQLPKSKRSRVSCECPETGQAPKKNVRNSPANASREDPLNQGIKVLIKKKMCPLFAKN